MEAQNEEKSNLFGVSRKDVGKSAVKPFAITPKERKL